MLAEVEDPSTPSGDPIDEKCKGIVAMKYAALTTYKADFAPTSGDVVAVLSGHLSAFPGLLFCSGRI